MSSCTVMKVNHEPAGNNVSKNLKQIKIAMGSDWIGQCTDRRYPSLPQQGFLACIPTPWGGYGYFLESHIVVR